MILNNEFGSPILKVCETFVSVQGESTWAGCPCFFIRLAGCNLRCRYCDTEYAREDGKPCTVGGLVTSFRESGMRLVEVTGGEPLLQRGTIELLNALLPFGTVLIETNGTMDISRIPEGVVAVMDIKCPGSGESESIKWSNVNLLRSYDEVKFVICDRFDYEWALREIERHDLARKCRAVLMSAASGFLDDARLAKWLMESRLPIRLNPQVHRQLKLR